MSDKGFWYAGIFIFCNFVNFQYFGLIFSVRYVFIFHFLALSRLRLTSESVWYAWERVGALIGVLGEVLAPIPEVLKKMGPYLFVGRMILAPGISQQAAILLSELA